MTEDGQSAPAFPSFMNQSGLSRGRQVLRPVTADWLRSCCGHSVLQRSELSAAGTKDEGEGTPKLAEWKIYRRHLLADWPITMVQTRRRSNTISGKANSQHNVEDGTMYSGNADHTGNISDVWTTVHDYSHIH